MRPSYVLAFLLLLPPAYLGYGDFTKYRAPDQPFKFSTVGEVWLQQDPAGFQEYKAEYAKREREWNEEVRPYLDMQAFPIVIIPGAAFSLWLLIALLLGIGPFKDWEPSVGGGSSGEGIGRASAGKRGGKVTYSRK